MPPKKVVNSPSKAKPSAGGRKEVVKKTSAAKGGKKGATFVTELRIKEEKIKEESEETTTSKGSAGKSIPGKKEEKTLGKRKATSQVPAEEEDCKKGKTAGRKRVKVEKNEDEDASSQPWRWWEESAQDGTQWKTLKHNGVLFPPPYQPHGVRMLYNNKPLVLSPEQEEAATFYANYLDSQHVQKDAFNKNFFEQFQALLKTTTAGQVVKSMELCDFRPIKNYLDAERERRKARTKEEKDAEKKLKAEMDEKYGWAEVDGHRQKVANYRVEPPGLFLGRGAHPKTGMIKARLRPGDVTINIGQGEPIPQSPVPGESWGAIRHDNKVSWLAMWRENINGAVKYVFLAPQSALKGRKDMKKFERARELKGRIQQIREAYEADMENNVKLVRQRGTALWVIDKLALRVGNEKGEDEADTVGCCSLRVEHVKLHEGNQIEFDFLGKDSMRYHNVVEVPERVYRNFRRFVQDKGPTEDLFDHLNSQKLNEYLKELMPGLSAKVFRTYNASITLEQELYREPVDPKLSINEKLLFFNRANRQVAILCNHQRSVSAKFGESMTKLERQLEDLRDFATDLKYLHDLLKKNSADAEESISKAAARYTKRMAAKAATRAAEDSEASSQVSSQAAASSQQASSGSEKLKKEVTWPKTAESAQKAIARVKDRIKKLEVARTERDELKTVALTTSKVNYIDPRIPVAWCLRNGIPVEKVFSKTLREKFAWAVDMADEDFDF